MDFHPQWKFDRTVWKWKTSIHSFKNVSLFLRVENFHHVNAFLKVNFQGNGSNCLNRQNNIFQYKTAWLIYSWSAPVPTKSWVKDLWWSQLLIHFKNQSNSWEDEERVDLEKRRGKHSSTHWLKAELFISSLLSPSTKSTHLQRLLTLVCGYVHMWREGSRIWNHLSMRELLLHNVEKQ